MIRKSVLKGTTRLFQGYLVEILELSIHYSTIYYFRNNIRLYHSYPCGLLQQGSQNTGRIILHYVASVTTPYLFLQSVAVNNCLQEGVS